MNLPISRAYQSVYDGLAALTTGKPQRFSRRITRLGLEKFRRLFVRLADDPVVRMRFLGRELRVPLSHNLVFYQKENPSYSLNLARVARSVREKYPDLTCIDIGGNIGDSVILIRQAGNLRILTVEGDSRFYRLLESNLADDQNVTIERSFIGWPEEPMSVRKKGGTSQLIPRTAGDPAIAVKTFDQLIAAHGAFANSKLLKIDADGFDFSILLAARNWIGSTQPVLYFEYDPALAFRDGPSGLEILRLCSRLGYEKALFWDANGRFVLGCSLSEWSIIEDLDEYIGRGSILYWDVCLTHKTDDDVAFRLRDTERCERRQAV